MRRSLCPHCRKRLEAGQRIHWDCIPAWWEAQQAKEERKAEKQARMAAKVDKAETRRRLREMRPLRAFIKDAQDAFNQWVRCRDEGLPCISCGELNPIELGPGGAWDAGHFLGRGAHPEKRFMEDNCHRQCKVCNAGSAKNPAKAKTVHRQYEQELLRRIGPERFEAVNAPLPVHKWTREELVAIRDHYKAKTKELRKQEA
ncbi:MAG TPA: recombination protein NinG [Acidovorax sp.]|nr:recombination protein NinG [Acidovorax sp.]